MNLTLEGTGEGMINSIQNTRERQASGTKLNQSFTAGKTEPILTYKRQDSPIKKYVDNYVQK